ncbi:P63C domain-containing protein [Flavobacterium sp.]|uniref:P63C domain-containing protein n=1 Tax=Flavobacterium sp. TaxID=239 RepID=UPI00261A11A1|nr:P63C domain-containing protein [Flavobacterium sp.]
MSSTALKIAYGSTHLPLKLGESSVSCFILSNNQYVLPISSVQKLLGYDGKSETWLLNIMNNISKFTKISKDLLQAYEDPIKVVMNSTKKTPQIIALIDSTIFLETCKTFVDAKNDGLLGVHLIKISKTAEKILKNTTHQNINMLIAVATGYETHKEQVKSLLIKYLQTELNDDAVLWIKTFPDAFFKTLFEIHEHHWNDMKTRPDFIGKVLYDLIFSRISSALLVELREHPPKRSYTRKGYAPQDNEHPELKKHLEELMTLLETSGNDWFIFLQLVQRSFPIKNHYTNTLKFEKPTKNKPLLSSFNKQLRKLT